MNKIAFGTDGWRAIIGDEFSITNVARVAEGAADWLKLNMAKPSVVIGYDTRFGGKLFAETVAKVFAFKNIKVYLTDKFCSTPMVSLGTAKLGAGLGVVITASHNPPEYNGFKLKGAYGGPLLSDKVAEIEKLIPDKCSVPYHEHSIKELSGRKTVEYIDLETLYINHVKENFDLDSLKESTTKWAYDAMFGAGQNVIRKLFPETKLLRCDDNPGFHGQAPEPIEKNLKDLQRYIKSTGDMDFGLATDGDADRLGIFDNEGNFIDSHHMILMLIHYLTKYKGMHGKVVTAFSTSQKIKALCHHYGLDYDVTKIGFKYICDKMVMEDVLIGGEESGGMAIKGHIPERDGIWVGLILWEMMVKTGKSLKEIMEEIYTIVGRFHVEREDLHLREDIKQKIISNCKKAKYDSFGRFSIIKRDDLDGFKFYIEEDKWVMIRPSGTEPVLRIYVEAHSKQEALNMLESCKETVLEKELVS